METSISGVSMNVPWMNASGVWCTTSDQLLSISTVNVGAVVSKSSTLLERSGNPKPRYFGSEKFSINSMGIPNLGAQFYIGMKEKIHKPYIMSVSGLSVDENIKILEKVKSSNVDLVELNVSCPNVIGKPQLGYDMEGFSEALRRVSEMWDNQKPLGLKLPPYFDFSHFDQVSDIIIENQPTVRFLTCCNSFGNGLYVDFDKESTVIFPKNGFGGVGGYGLKPTSLANVRKFYTLLNIENNTNVDLIGCGGINNGTDVFEYILCGASAVQIGTELQHRGLDLFEKIKNEFQSILDQKGYKKIYDFKGKLKTIGQHDDGVVI